MASGKGGLRNGSGTGGAVGEPLSPPLPDGSAYFDKIKPLPPEPCPCCGLTTGFGSDATQKACRGPYKDPVAKARSEAPGDSRLPATPSPFGKMVSGR